MTDWIEQKTARVKTKKEDAQIRRAQGLDAVRQLEAMVRRDVAKWNELNPSYRRKIDGVLNSMLTGSFQVNKTSFPPASVRIILAPDSLSIQFECTKIDPGGREAHTTKDEFGLKPALTGTLCGTTHSGAPISLEEASRILLEPIVDNIGDSL